MELSSLRIDSEALTTLNQYDQVTGLVTGFKVTAKPEAVVIGEPLNSDADIDAILSTVVIPEQAPHVEDGISKLLTIREFLDSQNKYQKHSSAGRE